MKPRLSDNPDIAVKQIASSMAEGSIVTKALARYLEQVIEFVFEEYVQPLREQMIEWRDIESAPSEGFFLAWSPDHPDLVMTWKAEIFRSACQPGTPKHLSANHFTKWAPIPLPKKELPDGE